MLKIKNLYLGSLFSLFVFIPSILGQSRMYLKSGIKKQKITFEFIHNLIILPVELNGKTLNLILDTGSSKTIIFGIKNSDSIQLNKASKISLRGLGSGEAIEGIISKNNQLKLQNIVGVNQTIYVVLDDKFDLSSKMGKTIHGIIGFELIKNFIVDINYTTHHISFQNPSKKLKQKNSKYHDFDLTFYNKKPYITANISLSDHTKKKVKLLLDTGSSDALWLFEDKEQGIISPPKYFLDNLGEGLSGTITGKRSKINSFELKSFKFKNPTTAFLDSSATAFARSYKGRNGSIGSRIFKRFRVVLDYPNQKIYLKKAKNFNKEFKYNRAGIEIVHIGKILTAQNHLFQNTFLENKQTSELNKIIFEIDYKYIFKPLYAIHSIRPNSPADLAGLRANDIIKVINGKPTYEYEMDELNALFYGAVGSTLKLSIERNGILFYYQFKLRKLL